MARKSVVILSCWRWMHVPVTMGSGSWIAPCTLFKKKKKKNGLHCFQVAVTVPGYLELVLQEVLMYPLFQLKRFGCWFGASAYSGASSLLFSSQRKLPGKLVPEWHQHFAGLEHVWTPVLTCKSRSSAYKESVLSAKVVSSNAGKLEAYTVTVWCDSTVALMSAGKQTGS